MNTLPVTVVDRQADGGISAHVPTRLTPKVGRWTRAQLTISNKGPHVVSDATVTIGVPRALQVRASLAGGTCTPVPIRCAAPALAPGKSAVLTLATRARRLGTFGVPIGISSASARDPDPANDTVRLRVSSHS